MSRRYPTRREASLVPTLHGDESGVFDITLLDKCFAALEASLPRNASRDDYVFQSQLRFYASLFYFLGGTDFTNHLCEEMPGYTLHFTIERWLKGQSAPALSMKKRVLEAARRVVQKLRLTRSNGASLYDVTSNK
ncbi:MAG TPA: hypothetical protein VGE31_01850 [Candidatus Paceibacterota bacterium]